MKKIKILLIHLLINNYKTKLSDNLPSHIERSISQESASQENKNTSYRKSKDILSNMEKAYKDI